MLTPSTLKRDPHDVRRGTSSWSSTPQARWTATSSTSSGRVWPTSCATLTPMIASTSSPSAARRAHLCARPRPRSEARLRVDWMYDLEALGGTNIYLALSETLPQADPERSHRDRLPHRRAAHRRHRRRRNAPEYTGPGSARGRAHLPLRRRLRRQHAAARPTRADHRGRPTYVEPQERIDEKVSAFYARIKARC